ncbi:hypothetical protein OS493_031997 [Desmophyllum pertusum]|uniref:Short-chain dehydrogenase/reductase SDR n=1 Tax=Desmophyllum pertusum TaxID=174260 RepID=A0A9W9Z9F1_9CNID|nr:hypothetical protein OS493_031997 [Desmophyllum pertusum]
MCVLLVGDVATDFGIGNTDAEARKEYEISDDIKRLEPRDIANAVVYAVTQPAHCTVSEVMVEPIDAPF